jgi:hypothetical protein
MSDQPNLAAALVAALSDLAVIEKDHNVSTGSYSYSYADLGSIIKKTRPVLAEHGVVVIQSIEAHGDGLAVMTTLLHASGDYLPAGPLPFPHGKDAQATGSWITYMRRYALLAALGMATGEDDDGAAAVPRQEAPVVPGYIRSVVEAREKLTLPERTALREWMTEQGLPGTPSQLTEAEADKVVQFILHGLPKVDDGKFPVT